MAAHKEKRAYRRNPNKASIRFLDTNIENCCKAEMGNYSETGMYFRSNFALQPEKVIHIWIENHPSESPFPEPYESCRAVVKFCKKITEAETPIYGIGVRLLEKLSTFNPLKPQAKIDELRKRAEQSLHKYPQIATETCSQDPHELIHELQVHQIELEMQNDELRRAQQEIELSRSRYSYLYDFAPIGYFTLDRYGQILEVNLTGANLLGIERAKLIKTPVSAYINEEDQDLFRLHRLEIMKTKTRQCCELKLKRKNGPSFYAQLQSKAVEDAEGTSTQILISVTDIDERKRVEKEKNKLEDRLRQAQKMEAIGTLAGGVAHNFNNLLMGIQGRISLMLMETDPGHPNYAHLQSTEETIRNAAKLTRELLGFARGGKYETRPTDFNELIKNTYRIFALSRKDIEYRLELEENLWTVNVDRGQMEAVVLNLYNNSMQAMPGGGAINLRTENVFLNKEETTPFNLKAGKFVKISVRDTGTGMDEATRQRMFEPFFSTKGIGRGTGLGLASVYGIIRNHDGSIQVFSKKGEGTTFEIHLPASEKKVVDERELANEFLHGTETILLVDDEEMITDVSTEMLKKLGYHVLTAMSGSEAIDLYTENHHRIDLIVLDMIMPRMGGAETYRRLKGIHPDVRVLISTGYDTDGQATTLLDQGCRGVIQKPFRLTDLSKKLREVLDDENGA